jgi:hypothetical protein
MRTLTFLAAFVLGMLPASGQIMLSEDFSGTTWPPAGWSIDQQATNWSRVSTAHAGGTSPELRLSWSPAFTGTTRFVSPVLDLSSNTQGTALISFRHAVDHYSGNFTIGLAVRKAGGTWSTIWSQTVSGDIPAQEKTFEIPEEHMASDSFQMAFFFNGNSFNINYWYIDDVQVLIPLDIDLAISNVSVERYFYEPAPVQGTVVNLGFENITTFDLNWQAGDGPLQTTTFADLDIPLGGNHHFTADQLMDLEPGMHELEVFISNVNGLEQDDNPGNDLFSTTISVAHQQVSRMPLFEEFTSSTCPPCATFNNTFFNQFTNQNAENMVLIKYQMNWPGAGDPYYTAEGGVRRQFYGVNSVPFLFVNGQQVATSGSAVNNAYQQALQRPSFLDISGFYTTDGNNIILEGSLMPYADFWEVRLHVVVIERVTYGNVGTNGETSFHHVMMKMLPNAQGTQPTLTANQSHVISYTHDMSSTFAEDMDDLMVVVFLQDNNTREVLQSAYFANAPMEALDVTSFPDGDTQVDPDHIISVNFNQPLTHTDGAEITTESLLNVIEFSQLEGNKGEISFTATINEQKNQIVITPDEHLGFENAYHLHIGPLAGVWGQPVEVDLSFTTRASFGAPTVAFNVNDQSENIPVDQVFVISFNQAVTFSNGTMITNSNANELILFATYDAAGEPVSFNATINDDRDIISIAPSSPLLHLQQYFLEVDAVMGVDLDVNQPASVTFSTEEALSVSPPGSVHVNVYPNPAQYFIRAEIGSVSGNALVRLLDSRGNLVLEEFSTNHQITLEVGHLAAGQYFLEIRTNEGRTVKIVNLIQ